MVMIGRDQMEPSKLQVRRLLEQGWAKKKQYPTTLFAPVATQIPPSVATSNSPTPEHT
jgi:hypothetical protein